MLFCKDCGVALGIFGKDHRDYCATCVQRHTPQPLPSNAVTSGDVDLLAEAALSLENGKMVLRSKEGWELWSGSPGIKIELKTLFAQARRIYAIRLRRQKN